MLLGVDVSASGTINEAECHLGSLHFGHRCPVGETVESQFTRRLVALGLEVEDGAEAVLRLPVKPQFVSMIEIHLVHLLPSESSEDIVLVGEEEFVRRRHDVMCRCEGDGAYGELQGLVFLFVE